MKKRSAIAIAIGMAFTLSLAVAAFSLGLGGTPSDASSRATGQKHHQVKPIVKVRHRTVTVHKKAAGAANRVVTIPVSGSTTTVPRVRTVQRRLPRPAAEVRTATSTSPRRRTTARARKPRVTAARRTRDRAARRTASPMTDAPAHRRRGRSPRKGPRPRKTAPHGPGCAWTAWIAGGERVPGSVDRAAGCIPRRRSRPRAPPERTTANVPSSSSTRCSAGRGSATRPARRRAVRVQRRIDVDVVLGRHRTRRPCSASGHEHREDPDDERSAQRTGRASSALAPGHGHRRRTRRRTRNEPGDVRGGGTRDGTDLRGRGAAILAIPKRQRALRGQRTSGAVDRGLLGVRPGSGHRPSRGRAHRRAVRSDGAARVDRGRLRQELRRHPRGPRHPGPRPAAVRALARDRPPLRGPAAAAARGRARLRRHREGMDESIEPHGSRPRSPERHGSS